MCHGERHQRFHLEKIRKLILQVLLQSLSTNLPNNAIFTGQLPQRVQFIIQHGNICT